MLWDKYLRPAHEIRLKIAREVRVIVGTVHALLQTLAGMGPHSWVVKDKINRALLVDEAHQVTVSEAMALASTTSFKEAVFFHDDGQAFRDFYRAGPPLLRSWLAPPPPTPLRIRLWPAPPPPTPPSTWNMACAAAVMAGAAPDPRLDTLPAPAQLRVCAFLGPGAVPPAASPLWRRFRREPEAAASSSASAPPRRAPWAAELQPASGRAFLALLLRFGLREAERFESIRRVQARDWAYWHDEGWFYERDWDYWHEALHQLDGTMMSWKPRHCEAPGTRATDRGPAPAAGSAPAVRSPRPGGALPAAGAGPRPTWVAAVGLDPLSYVNSLLLA